MPEVTDPNILAVLNGGPKPAGGNATAMPPGSVPGIIPGRPKPPPVFTPPSGYQGDQTGLAPIPGGPADPNTGAPPSGYRFDGQGGLEPIPGGPADKGKPQDTEGAASKLVRVIGQLDKIYADSADSALWPGFGETGLSGSALRSVPGTAAYGLQQDINTIDANMAFDALQKMRDASPTGGALGSITEKELDLLKSTISSLNPNQSQSDFIRKIGEAKSVYLEQLRQIDPAAADEIEQRGNPVMGSDGAITYDQRGRDALTSGGSSDGGGSPPPAGPGYWSQVGDLLAAGVGDIAQAGGDLAGLVVNPVGQTLYNALGYDQAYDTGQIVRDAMGAPQGNEAISEINKFAASAMTGAGAARSAASLLNPGTAQAVAQTLARTPIRDTIAGAGAGAGSVAGRESGVPGGEYIGALLGGLAGYGGANTSFNALAPRAPTPLAEAAVRQSVDLLPSDAGGRIAQMATSGTKASPVSANPVVKQAQENTRQLSQAAWRTAETQGEIVGSDLAGQNIRSAADRYAKQTRDRFGRLYDKAHEEAKGVKIKPLQTIEALDTRIGRLKNDPSAPESAVTELQGFRDRIADGVNVQGLRDARTRLSEGVYDGKIRSTVDQAAWKEILGNLSSDIELGLQNAGRSRAAGMFKRADDGWKQRVEHIDEVLQPIVGKDGMKSGEDVLKAVETMARGGAGGNARLSRLLGNMSDEEAGQVRAVVVDRLGKATPGSQDAAGEVFSPSTFLTNWNRMTPQAKASLFSNAELRRNLDDIALLADGMKGSRSMENFSNTAVAAGANVGAGVALAATHPMSVFLAAGGQYLTGRLMASPKFAKILATSSKLPPEVANRRLMEEFGILAKSEPLLADDLSSLVQALNDNGVGVGAAASDRPEDQNK